MKHKNLPWIARQEADGGLWTVLDSAGNVVFFGMQEHVAKTFAAAPDLAEAAEKAVKSHQYKTPAGTMNCRYCDANMDHEGTYRDMHAEGCVIPELRAALAKAGAK